MMRGRVTTDGSEAALLLRIFGFLNPGQAGRQVEIHVVIDAGFTGYITLSAELKISLDLPELGLEELWLADGSTEIAAVHRAAVQWHGRSRAVPVLAVGGESLIGMALLAGSRFEMDAVPGGEVLIEEC